MNSNESNTKGGIERPTTTPDFDTLEECVPYLLERDQFLYWDARSDRPKKPVENPGDYKGASWSSPDAWSSYDDVREQVEAQNPIGFGYVFANDFAGEAEGEYGAIDIDGCLRWTDDGPKPKDWLPSLQPFIERGAYIEVSPSGGGLHIPLKDFSPPDWWSDVHFSDEEHEGVEAYGKKFFTLTGEQFDQHLVDEYEINTNDAPKAGEWVEAFLRACYKAITDEDPLHVNTPDLSDDYDEWEDTSAESQTAAAKKRREEFLDEEDIADALDHIDPDVTYITWRDIGFALTDWCDSPGQASELFQEWSSSGSKWDDKARKQAKRIIDDGGSGDRTIGTVIHLARQNGWEMPDPPSPEPLSEDDDIVLQELNNLQMRVDGIYKNLNYGEKDEDGNPKKPYYVQLSNFNVTVDARREYAATERELREYTLTVSPHCETDYKVTVDTSAFNSTRDFKDNVVTGFGTVWNGEPQDIQTLRQMLAEQNVQTRTVVDYIGTRGKKFVTPEGTFTADGWTNNPEYTIDEDNNLSEEWNLSPEKVEEIDEAEVAEIVELAPQQRKKNRGIPAFAWFYAAPWRSLIKSEEGQFNNLYISGPAGSGKSAFARSMSSMFGLNELQEARATNYIYERTLSSTDTVPVVLDEYKPSDWPQHEVDDFHEYLRKITDNQPVQKGTQDLGYRYLRMRAPVAVVGEQAVKGTAEQRRALMTTFSLDAAHDPEYGEAFAKLTGDRFNDETYEKCDYKQHAYAYYCWMLKQDVDELRDLWQECAIRAEEITNGLDLQRVDNAKQAAYGVVLFGTRVFQRFAEEYGVSSEEHGVTIDAAERSIEYLATSGDGAEGKSYLDEYLDIAGRAVEADYLVEEEHYARINKNKPTEEIALRKAAAYDKVSQYVRDHDLGVNMFDDYTDYRSRIRDAEDDEESPVVAYNKATRLASGIKKCDRFEPEALGLANVDEDDEDDADDSDDDEDGDNDDTESLSDLDFGFASDVTVEVSSLAEPKPWQDARGVVVGPSGVPMDFVVEDVEDESVSLEVGAEIHLDNVRVDEDENGVRVLRIIPGTTEVVTESTETDDDEQAPIPDTEEQAATDGGSDAAQATRVQSIIDTLAESDGTMTLNDIATATNLTDDQVAADLRSLVESGPVICEVEDSEEVFHL